MNILPKKSWHVRNRDNIERVRRDEAKAAEEEKEKQRRIALAEQEARTEFLRKKAKSRQIEPSQSDQEASALAGTSQDAIAIIEKPKGHINFFKAEEEGQKHGKNADYQAEKKAEKEKYEKDIGLLTYLGQSAVESQHSKPWYYTAPDRKRKAEDSSKQEDPQKKSRKEEFDQKRKNDLDPIRQMTQYLQIKEKHRNVEQSSARKEKHKKHKHKKDKTRDEDGPSSSGKKTIEQLRAERLKREKEERKRAEELMAKARGESVPDKEKEVVLDERQRSYNSQFNPEYVRKPRHKSYDYY